MRTSLPQRNTGKRRFNDFLIDFGLDIATRPPMGSGVGGAISTALASAKDPFDKFKQSRAGEEFAAASGDPIPNLGGMKVPIITREMTQCLMSVTAAPVLKPLMSVKQLCNSGHAVVFDEEDSYFVNKATGELNELREENGNYMLDCWVPPNESGFGGLP